MGSAAGGRKLSYVLRKLRDSKCGGEGANVLYSTCWVWRFECSQTGGKYYFMGGGEEEAY